LTLISSTEIHILIIGIAFKVVGINRGKKCKKRINKIFHAIKCSFSNFSFYSIIKANMENFSKWFLMSKNKNKTLKYPEKYISRA
jgi:hypothetical protein